MKMEDLGQKVQIILTYNEAELMTVYLNMMCYMNDDSKCGSKYKSIAKNVLEKLEEYINT